MFCVRYHDKVQTTNKKLLTLHKLVLKPKMLTIDLCTECHFIDFNSTQLLNVTVVQFYTPSRNFRQIKLKNDGSYHVYIHIFIVFIYSIAFDSLTLLNSLSSSNAASASFSALCGSPSFK